MKLRVPLIFLVLCVFAGLAQLFKNIFFIFPNNNILSSIQYLFLVGIVIFIFEKTKLSEKKANFFVCLILILMGSLIAYFTI